ncbi:hypothetical protein FDO65_16430 [Nakamurella flava]|uniref:Uncharacterized protein n=1 Tax=Nakamurella flava TaxID=2576308 RepID=A0A4U6QCF8_9ACTN|nr:hypothetical protein [Nakamurella flava]TKV57733.1 hypothetical protein FDO65_16430 [Nakamurella flava]
MLAPASPRPGSFPGPADRRRNAALVVIAIITGVLAILVPVVLAVRASGDEPAVEPTARTGAAAGRDRPDPAVPGSVPPTTTAAGTSLAPAVPVGPTGPAVVVVDAQAAATTPAPSIPSQSVPSAEGRVADLSFIPESAAAAPTDWMQALRPQVDPRGLATWVLEARGAWGATDGHTVYIDPNVPADKRWSVMVHEYGHVLQVRRYGNLNATAAALNQIVGADPSDKGPTESNADCIAELLGATWTDYGCRDALRPAAAALVDTDRAWISIARYAQP